MSSGIVLFLTTRYTLNTIPQDASGKAFYFGLKIVFEQNEKYIMAKTRAQKEETIVKVSEKLNRAKAVVFTDYKGFNMQQLSELRNKLRDQNAEFSITKNTLLDLALKNSQFQVSDSQLPQGPTATLFAYDDEVSPIKILVKTLKDTEKGKVKSGFLGKTSLDEAKILQLATLPTKDELRGKTVGVLVAPLLGILSVLNGNLRNLVYALNTIRKQKGGE